MPWEVALFSTGGGTFCNRQGGCVCGGGYILMRAHALLPPFKTHSQEETLPARTSPPSSYEI